MIDQVPTKNLEDLVDNIPVKRLGKPKNIIKTVDYIIENTDLCGASIDVNGGLF